MLKDVFWRLVDGRNQTITIFQTLIKAATHMLEYQPGL